MMETNGNVIYTLFFRSYNKIIDIDYANGKTLNKNSCLCPYIEKIGPNLIISNGKQKITIYDLNHNTEMPIKLENSTQIGKVVADRSRVVIDGYPLWIMDFDYIYTKCYHCGSDTIIFESFFLPWRKYGETNNNRLWITDYSIGPTPLPRRVYCLVCRANGRHEKKYCCIM